MMRQTQQGWILISLAASLSLSLATFADVNTVNDGPVVAGGTYLNTADGKTTFKNSAGGGLWLKSGSNIRGVEVNASGNLTNNGGTVHFYAPGNVVRLDGNIDVRGIRNNQGVYLGNGGKVFVDSAYLYQSGNIYANGFNGGLVQFNVGSATLTGNARIEAKGGVGSNFTTGQGGIIAINASGAVDLGRQTVLDSSGKVMGSLDTNVINIEGGLVNTEGLLQANGMDSRGGTVRIISAGQTDLLQTQDALSNAVTHGNFTSTEASTINTRLTALKNTHDGDIAIAAATSGASQANIFVNGHPGAPSSPGSSSTQNSGNDPSGLTRRAGDGGTIILTAARDIDNGGWLLANGGSGNPYRSFGDDPNVFVNGGHGGTISLNAGRNITNTGRIVSDGGGGGESLEISRGNSGGPAGLIAFSYDNQMQNAGVIRANGGFGAFIFNDGPNPNQGAGGNGGLVVFSSTNNPSGTGIVVTFGGLEGGPGGTRGRLGSIVAPNPPTSTNTLIGVWRKTEPLEMLTHAENLILLGNKLPFEPSRESELENEFSAWTKYARVRSVADPQGELSEFDRGPALDEFGSKISIPGQAEAAYPYRNFVLANSTNRRILFFNPDQLTRGFVNKISVAPFNTISALSAGYMGFGNVVGDVEATQFGNGMGGGRFSLIAKQFGQQFPLYVNGGVAGGSIHIATSGKLATGGALGPVLTKTLSTGGTIHGGSIILKAGQELESLNTGTLMQANGGLAGGNIQLLSQNNLFNFGKMQANGAITGGSVLLQALNQLSNYSDAPKRIEANGGNYGGFIRLKAAEFVTTPPGFVPIQLQATGSIQNGQIVTGP